MTKHEVEILEQIIGRLERNEDRLPELTSELEHETFLELYRRVPFIHHEMSYQERYDARIYIRQMIDEDQSG